MRRGIFGALRRNNTGWPVLLTRYFHRSQHIISRNFQPYHSLKMSFSSKERSCFAMYLCSAIHQKRFQSMCVATAMSSDCVQSAMIPVAMPSKNWRYIRSMIFLQFFGLQLVLRSSPGPLCTAAKRSADPMMPATAIGLMFEKSSRSGSRKTSSSPAGPPTTSRYEREWAHRLRRTGSFFMCAGRFFSCRIE